MVFLKSVTMGKDKYEGHCTRNYGVVLFLQRILGENERHMECQQDNKFQKAQELDF
jgi:hypothetical protein